MSSSNMLSKLLPCCFGNPYAAADAYLQPLNTRAGAAGLSGVGGGPGASGGGYGGGGGASLGGGGPGASAGRGTSLDELLDRTAAAREALWRSLGELEPLVLRALPGGGGGGGGAPGGSSSAGPRWPAGRCAFRLIRRPATGTVILATDGLSDPFDDLTLGDGNVNGFGLEFYIEAPGAELPGGAGGSVSDAKTAWQFQLLYTVAQLAAGHGGIRAVMDDLALLSTEAEGVAPCLPPGAAPALVNPAGRVGALLGLKWRAEAGPDGGAPSSSSSPSSPPIPDRIAGMPLTDVLLVNVKLLALPELALIAARGAAGRAALDAAFGGPGRLVSSLARAPVAADVLPQ